MSSSRSPAWSRQAAAVGEQVAQRHLAASPSGPPGGTPGSCSITGSSQVTLPSPITPATIVEAIGLETEAIWNTVSGVDRLRLAHLAHAEALEVDHLVPVDDGDGDARHAGLALGLEDQRVERRHRRRYAARGRPALRRGRSGRRGEPGRAQQRRSQQEPAAAAPPPAVPGHGPIHPRIRALPTASFVPRPGRGGH